ncbi:MAG: hypothetical protein A3C93_03320 [Candidatus Lloydbacteria bacterium RIFCSPHIGHO2_02_FULL_54_17]|uniref:Uncharacterized protein n=1 Tax=Candidatus Lloydbacteria bacterium RIFCSPHIGHO2_02_FULL_54_17 TaxID=1798664 RepID=A0A1G2DFG8_9BACT|nr:MAG: hypothetical protein A2762_04030 [Candidatus Lloydbacteria bacterium RIFCSPHIGHO2_01_FULL_54_11]OGZ12316.1 MAG: hypothetical protein A3C93_03320 [Candidatus Lloydbacteria bacterium RIFCSPHIGHO2_02_FULL_54_17]OGZ14590.1 MAG: hypothetical protein A2948_05800 [Candidatus Lloydbacteria bacterium RIFCSPLOWO2_01_FULL_54_18]OGZ16322.1 MAG: hypothetical protein A3H76_06580 [Candidatus Lloydbacteria bacterium RIFCSPLOWO2_02_FULL_54_12]
MKFPTTFTHKILKRNTTYLLAREKKTLALFIATWCVVSAVAAVVAGSLIAAVLLIFGIWSSSLLALRSTAFCFDETGYRRRGHTSKGSIPYSDMKDVRIIQWELEKRHNTHIVEIELKQDGIIDCVGLTEESARGLRNELLYRIDHSGMSLPTT